MPKQRHRAATRIHTTSWRSRRFLLALAAITGLALVLRLLICAQLASSSTVVSPPLVADMATYQALALQISAGDWPSHFYYQPLYYALFLPAIYLIFGTGIWGPMLIQAGLGVATVWLTGLCGARLFGRKAGLLAAALLALARYHIFYTPFLLVAVLQAFLLTLLLWLALRAWDCNRNRDWGGMALIAAVATLTRGNVLLLMPGFFLLLAWRNRNHPRRAIYLCAMVAVLFYLPQLPFAWRNYQHYGRWTGPSSAADAVLAIGNRPEAPPGGLPQHQSLTLDAWLADAALPGAARISVTSQIRRWIQQEPLAFLELKWRMALLYWDGQEIDNNVTMAQEAPRSQLLRSPFLADFALLGSLAITGLVLCCRRPLRSPPRLLLVALIVIYWLATVLFYILARFRLPAVPLLCIMAGAAMAELLALARRGCQAKLPRRQLARAAAALLIGLVVVNAAFPLYQSCCEAWVMRRVQPGGIMEKNATQIRVYDHGPVLFSGWSAHPIPLGGMIIEKQLGLPSAELPVQMATLRLPLLAESPAQLRIQAWVDATAATDQIVSLRHGTRAEWVELALPDQAFLNTTRQHCRIRLKLTPVTGQSALLVDVYRNYGRSYFLQAGQLNAQDAELGLELQWRRPPPQP